MSATQVTTSEATQIAFTDGLLALGFDETALRSLPYSATTTWSKPGASVSVKLTVEEVTTPGLDDMLRASVLELNEKGHYTGIDHVSSHLSPRNVPAVLAFIAALAEAAL